MVTDNLLFMPVRLETLTLARGRYRTCLMWMQGAPINAFLGCVLMGLR